MDGKKGLVWKERTRLTSESFLTIHPFCHDIQYLSDKWMDENLGQQMERKDSKSTAIHALALNFTRVAAKATPTPRQNRWPTILASKQLLNVDASFSEGFHSGSCRAIVRDETPQG